MIGDHKARAVESLGLVHQHVAALVVRIVSHDHTPRYGGGARVLSVQKFNELGSLGARSRAHVQNLEERERGREKKKSVSEVTYPYMYVHTSETNIYTSRNCRVQLYQTLVAMLLLSVVVHYLVLLCLYSKSSCLGHHPDLRNVRISEIIAHKSNEVLLSGLSL